MPWAKIDDQFYDHPKVVEAGLAAAGLFTMALSYTARHLTDGFIATRMVRRFCAELDDPLSLAQRLVEVGLWEIAEGGYLIHDYLEYNPSAESVQADREEARERMRAARESSGKFGKRSEEVRANISRTSEEVRSTPSPSPSPSPSPIPNPVAAAAEREQPSPKNSSSSNRVKHLFALLDRAGVTPSPFQSEQWCALLDLTPDDTLLDDAFTESATKNNRQPTVAYIRSILTRCLAEGKRPGEFGGNGHDPGPRSPPVRLVKRTIVHPLTGERFEAEVVVSD